VNPPTTIRTRTVCHGNAGCLVTGPRILGPRILVLKTPQNWCTCSSCNVTNSRSLNAVIMPIDNVLMLY